MSAVEANSLVGVSASEASSDVLTPVAFRFSSSNNILSSNTSTSTGLLPVPSPPSTNSINNSSFGNRITDDQGLHTVLSSSNNVNNNTNSGSESSTSSNLSYHSNPRAGRSSFHHPNAPAAVAATSPSTPLARMVRSSSLSGLDPSASPAAIVDQADAVILSGNADSFTLESATSMRAGASPLMGHSVSGGSLQGGDASAAGALFMGVARTSSGNTPLALIMTPSGVAAAAAAEIFEDDAAAGDDERAAVAETSCCGLFLVTTAPAASPTSALKPTASSYFPPPSSLTERSADATSHSCDVRIAAAMSTTTTPKLAVVGGGAALTTDDNNNNSESSPVCELMSQILAITFHLLVLFAIIVPAIRQSATESALPCIIVISVAAALALVTWILALAMPHQDEGQQQSPVPPAATLYSVGRNHHGTILLRSSSVTAATAAGGAATTPRSNNNAHQGLFLPYALSDVNFSPVSQQPSALRPQHSLSTAAAGNSMTNSQDCEIASSSSASGGNNPQHSPGLIGLMISTPVTAGESVVVASPHASRRRSYHVFPAPLARTTTGGGGATMTTSVTSAAVVVATAPLTSLGSPVTSLPTTPRLHPLDNSNSNNNNNNTSIHNNSMSNLFSSHHHLVGNSALSVSRVEVRFCDKCELFVTLTSRHCRKCNVCCEGFDHHCNWLGRCVGVRNHIYFAAVVSSVLFLSIISLASCIFFIAEFAADRDLFQRRFALAYSLIHAGRTTPTGPTSTPGTLPLPSSLSDSIVSPRAESASIAVLVFLCLDAALVLVMMCLFVFLSSFHVYLAAVGWRTLDFVRWYRAEEAGINADGSGRAGAGGGGAGGAVSESKFRDRAGSVVVSSSRGITGAPGHKRGGSSASTPSSAASSLRLYSSESSANFELDTHSSDGSVSPSARGGSSSVRSSLRGGGSVARRSVTSASSTPDTSILQPGAQLIPRSLDLLSSAGGSAVTAALGMASPLQQDALDLEMGLGAAIGSYNILVVVDPEHHPFSVQQDTNNH